MRALAARVSGGVPAPGTTCADTWAILYTPGTTARPRGAQVTVQIVRLRPEKDLVNLTTIGTGAQQQAVCHGEALVLVLDVNLESSVANRKS